MPVLSLDCQEKLCELSLKEWVSEVKEGKKRGEGHIEVPAKQKH